MADFLFWFALALLGWLILSLGIGFLVGRMFATGTRSVFEEPERDWQWPPRGST